MEFVVHKHCSRGSELYIEGDKHAGVSQALFRMVVTRLEHSAYIK